MASQELKCKFCNIEPARVWHPTYGAICKYHDEHDHCLDDEKDYKECPICHQKVPFLKFMLFVGGPLVCVSCREKALDDMDYG